jgi:hypothetical protein
MTIVKVRRRRLSPLTLRKLQERSAILYARELDRWNSKSYWKS